MTTKITKNTKEEIWTAPSKPFKLGYSTIPRGGGITVVGSAGPAGTGCRLLNSCHHDSALSSFQSPGL